MLEFFQNNPDAVLPAVVAVNAIGCGGLLLLARWLEGDR